MNDKQSILELLDEAADKCRAEGNTPHSRRFRLPNDYIANLCEAAAKHIRCADDSIDYLENSVSAHEENNVKICQENRALMRYFNSVENVLESDSHDDWSEYQAAKAAVMGLATVLLKPIPEGVVDPDACQHAAIEGGRCLNCDEMMAGADALDKLQGGE